MLRYATVFKARPRNGIALLVISLVAFLLRSFRLEHQSLWYDEAFSVYLARMNLGDITTRTAADIQPPRYYYLLHFWVARAGDTEFAVRFLSLFFGVLTVPLMYATARRVFTPPAAIFSALLAVISPLYLWYSQETRMYTLITFLGLLSSYCLLRGIQGNSEGLSGTRRWWITFALANIAAVYTHYFAFVIIAFQLIYCFWRVLFRSSPRNRRGIPAPLRQLAIRPATRAGSPLRSDHSLLSFAAIVIAFIPWLPFVLARLGEDASYWRGALKLDEAIRHIFINFTMGESVLESIAQNIAALWLVVLLVSSIAWIIAQRKTITTTPTHPYTHTLSFAILYLIIPLALLLLLFSRNPKFNARYLMVASPGFLLLLSAGLGSLWTLARGLGKGAAFLSADSSNRSTLPGKASSRQRVFAGAVLLFALFLLLVTSLYADMNAFFDPAFTKADFRGVAQYITAHADGDEAIILTSGHMFPAFDYYYASASLPELRLPDDPTLNAEHVLNYSAAGELNRALAGKHGAWLVQWQDEVVDPNGFLPLLLTTNGQEQRVDASFWQIKLRHWRLPPDAHFSSEPDPGMPLRANFKNKVELLSWDSPNATPADQGASFNLYFQALDTFTEDYNVALRIVDAQGNFWGKLDRRPSGYNYPTTRWKKGEGLFGSYTVPLLPGAPSGDYFATATFFTTGDQTGLDVLASNGAPIGKTVKVGPIPVLRAEKQPAPVDLKIQHTINARVGPFTLLGYALAREKASTGESVPFTLFWRADEQPDADYTFQIQFGDRTSAALPLANLAFPTSQWHVGEIVRGQYLVQIPPDASAGVANLQVRLIGGSGHTVDLLLPFTIEKTDRVFVEPPTQFKQDANFNSLAGLVGYDLSAAEIKAGDTLTVTLDWKALSKMDKPYTVFVHLLDKDSQVAAQKDGQPLNGARATTSWVEGEYLADTYALAVKPDTPPGDYRLEIGWYDASDPTYARLQVIDANGNGAGDNVILRTSVIVQ
jgi:4-amino-4-deoxy-L-arabinose transferase-like glycosyltransferase